MKKTKKFVMLAMCLMGICSVLVMGVAASSGWATYFNQYFPVQKRTSYTHGYTCVVQRFMSFTSGGHFITGGTGIDGRFGPATENAVKVFQQNNGLQVDGHVGPRTWGTIGACLQDTGDYLEYGLNNPIIRLIEVGENSATELRYIDSDDDLYGHYLTTKR